MNPVAQARRVWMQTTPPSDPRDVGPWRLRRLWAFHDWVNLEIAARFRLPPGVERNKALGQMKSFILASVRELNARGFLLDGPALERFLVDKMAAIAKAQRERRIQNLWTYWATSWRTYVGLEADRLKRESMTARQHITTLAAGINPDDSMPAIVAAKHRAEEAEALRKHRGRTAKKQAEARQQTLF